MGFFYFFLYNFLLSLLVFIGLPFYLLDLLIRPKHRKGLSQKLGFLPQAIRDAFGDGSCFWIHAVSVGEVNSVIPMLKSLKKRHSSLKALLSVGTAAGFSFAREKAPMDGLIFFPFDLPWICGRVIRLLNPKFVIVTEKEIWPNFLHGLKQRNIPVIWINARVSPRSLRRYLVVKDFMRRVLASVSFFAADSEENRRRLIELGVDPKKTAVTGHTKLEQAGQSTDRIGKRVPAVLIGASTHEGEEQILCEVFKKVAAVKEDVSLILAPRHPERFEAVARLLDRHRIAFVRFSQLNGQKIPPAQKVMLLDRIGFLSEMYSIAEVAFVGGSLVPKGGHNIWEPAACGVSILYGPYMEQDYGLAEEGGAIRIGSPKELEREILALLNSAARRNELQRRTSAFLAKHRGAVEKNLQLVEAIYP